jgi:hypothetical protein
MAGRLGVRATTVATDGAGAAGPPTFATDGLWRRRTAQLNPRGHCHVLHEGQDARKRELAVAAPHDTQASAVVVFKDTASENGGSARSARHCHFQGFCRPTQEWE